jgi:hypothetical protein
MILTLVGGWRNAAFLNRRSRRRFAIPIQCGPQKGLTLSDLKKRYRGDAGWR